uniref:Endophilin-B1 n=1 Tax=Astyanax mexicanus TaxID=7994 RepID=A0A8B9JTF4_ASTMX
LNIILFNAAFTEEKLGQAERTELDAHLENLLGRAEATKHWTERVMKQTEVLLQPNPNVRMEEFLYEKLDRKLPTRANNHELLGECMIDAGHEFGPGTAYGGTQTITLKERKLLQIKRLDLDAAKTRVKKARAADARSELSSAPPLGEEYVAHFSYFFSFLHVRWLKAETELRIAQSEFDRQAEITRLLLEGVSSTHAHHLRCLNDFVDAQASYYAQCYQYMVNLQKQLGSFPATFSSNNNALTATSSASVSVAPPSLTPAPTPGQASPSLNELRSSSGPRKARVLYDYDAASSSELSLLADEVITVSSVPGMDSDWLMGERGHQKGKVPITYLELLN